MFGDKLFFMVIIEILKTTWLPLKILKTIWLPLGTSQLTFRHINPINTDVINELHLEINYINIVIEVGNQNNYISLIHNTIHHSIIRWQSINWTLVAHVLCSISLELMVDRVLHH